VAFRLGMIGLQKHRVLVLQTLVIPEAVMSVHRSPVVAVARSGQWQDSGQQNAGLSRQSTKAGQRGTACRLNDCRQCWPVRVSKLEIKVSSPDDQNRIKVIQDYFKLSDQGRQEILELFHEDAEIYFPKFGLGLGRQSLLEMWKGFEGSVEFIQHDYDTMTFIPSGDYIVVEGTSHGTLSGTTWTGGDTPGGRFCNVFRFRGDRISSVHIYLDPDYTGEDAARFRWGKNRRW
jgi:ketosteroid isomerase-like protein